jgi:hypothetical protein
VLLRIACVPCNLASLWTDEPRWFLASVCRARRRCKAELLDEQFRGTTLPPPSEPRVDTDLEL